MSYFRLLKCWHFVGEGGLEPPNSSEDRFTVCCNCRYATPPSSMQPAVLAGYRADEGTRTPDRLITNQLLYQLSYIGFIQPFKQLSFFSKSECKNTTFSETHKVFFRFLLKKYYNILLYRIIDINIFYSYPTLSFRKTTFGGCRNGEIGPSMAPLCQLMRLTPLLLLTLNDLNQKKGARSGRPWGRVTR